MDTRPGQALEDLQQSGGVLGTDGGFRREIVRNEIGWSKAEGAKKVAKLIGQEYVTVKKDLQLTFDVNEGTYMYRSKLTVQNVIYCKLYRKKYAQLMYTLGWIELTRIQWGTRCGYGLWGAQNCVKKGGLCGPRNTTYYVKNG